MAVCQAAYSGGGGIPSIAMLWHSGHQQSKERLFHFLLETHFSEIQRLVGSPGRLCRFWGANNFKNVIPVLFGHTLRVNYPRSNGRLPA